MLAPTSHPHPLGPGPGWAAEIARAFAAVRDASEVGQALAAWVDRLAPSELVGLLLLDPACARVRLVHHRGLRDSAAASAAETLAQLAAPATPLWAARTHMQAASPLPAALLSDAIAHGLSLPIHDEGQVVGTLVLGSARSCAYEAAPLTDLELLANMAGLTFRRLGATLALQRREAILYAVAAAAELFGAGPYGAQMDAALARLGEATAVSRVYVFEMFRDAAGTEFAAQRFEWVAPGVAPEIDNPVLQAVPMLDAGYGRWCQGLPRNEAIAGNVRDLPASEREILEAQGIVSIVIVPIFALGEWWGFMGFDECAHDRTWSTAEVDALKAAARLAGAAISRDHADRELRRRAEEQALLLDNIETQVWYLKDAYTYGAINRAHAEMLGHSPGQVDGQPLAAFFRPDELAVCEDSNRRVFTSGERLHTEEWVRDHQGQARLLSVVKSPKLAEDGRVEYVVASAEDITERRHIERELEAARSDLELRVAQRTAELREANARLEVEVHERRRMEEQSRERGRQLRWLAAELALAEERERRRLAIGLHDRIGQSLALCRMHLGAALHQVQGHAVQGPLAKIDTLLDEVMRDTRTLTFELSLPLLYELGLEAALEWLAEQATAKGAPCRASASGEPRDLAVDTRVLLFQVARELVANATTHARARSVHIRLEYGATRMALRVVDDGVGFPWPRPEGVRAAGYGLFSVRERIEALGGTFTLRSAPGEGTAVGVEVPA